MKAPASLPRATLTLLAGALLAQLLPLALGPWLARLYSPAHWGLYTSFAAVVANLAVVACARYDHALPLARDDGEAHALLALCLRLLLGTSLLATLGGLVAALAGWPLVLWLGPAVAAAALVQLGTLWATRLMRTGPLAASRVLQHGGGALAQVAGHGLLPGALGLVLGPVLAAGAAAALLLWRGIDRVRLARVDRAALGAVLRRHRDFPLLNTPHAFLGALQDTLTVALIAAWSGDVALGLWGLALRYLKAPATLVGSAVSPALYPRLVGAEPAVARRAVRQVIGVLGAIGALLALLLVAAGPALFAWAFGERWRAAGELARALAPYIGLHFVASPLSVVTLAWQAQGWALRLALVGQALFVGALALGLHLGGLAAAGWCVSAVMSAYFLYYLVTLMRWPLDHLSVLAAPEGARA